MLARQFRLRMSLSCAAALSVLAGATAAFASPAFYDSFSTADGAVPGNTVDSTVFDTGQTWTTQSAGQSNIIASTGLSYPSSYNNAPAGGGYAVNLTGDTGDHVQLASGQDEVTTPMYYSMLLTVPSTATIPAHTSSFSVTNGPNPNLVAAFSNGNGLTSNPGTSVAGVYVQQASDGNGFQIGLGGGQSSTGNPWFSTEFAYGTSVFVVVEGGGPNESETVSMWIDPALGQTAAPTPDLSFATSDAGGRSNSGTYGINSFVLAAEPGTQGVEVADLSLDGSYANVTPAGTALPEPASLSLLGLSGLLLLRRKARS